MMYLILTAVFLTVIFRLKADAVKPAARAGILLLLVFCAAAVPAGGPAWPSRRGLRSLPRIFPGYPGSMTIPLN